MQLNAEVFIFLKLDCCSAILSRVKHKDSLNVAADGEKIIITFSLEL